MWNKNKKTILGIVGALMLLAGLSYTNCGDKKMFGADDASSNSNSANMLEGRLSSGTYTVEFKDGTKVELRQPELAKYMVEFKDGSKVELLAPALK